MNDPDLFKQKYEVKNSDWPKRASVSDWRKIGWTANSDGTFLTKKGCDTVIVLIGGYWHLAKLCLPGKNG